MRWRVATSWPVNGEEQLHQPFQLKGAEGISLLDAWLTWAGPGTAGSPRSCSWPARSVTTVPASTLRSAQPRTVECPGGEREYETAAPDPHRLRVPLTRGPRRSRHARPRRAVPTTTRPRDHLIMPTDPAQEPHLHPGGRQSRPGGVIWMSLRHAEGGRMTVRT